MRHHLTKTTRRAFVAAALAAALALAVLGASGAAGQTATEPYALSYEGETFALNPTGAGMANDNANASGGRELYMWSEAVASKGVALPGAATRLTVRARAQLCGDQAPRLEVRQGGAVLGAVRVTGTSHADYSVLVDVPAGARNLALAYTNDFRSTACDRNVLVDRVTIEGTKAAAQTPPPPPPPAQEEPYTEAHENEGFDLNPSPAGMVMNDANASGGKELYIWSDASASKAITLPGKADSTTIRARGELCGTAAPRVELRVDGAVVGAVSVSTTSFADYTINTAIPGGAKQIALAYTNDFRSSTCDRNVRLDRVAFRGTKSATTSPDPAPTPVPGGNPIAGESLYVQPNNLAKQTADQWRSQGRTADAAQMDKIATTPVAMWFGGWNWNIQSEVNNFVTTVRNQGKLPVMLAYNIPVRDCGSYSAGGASSASEYRAWIRAYAAGIGNRKAVVVLEPDAIGDWGCLSAEKLAERKALLDDAITVLKSTSGAIVYVDIGYWNSAADSAQRLQSVGIAKADGFALNTSNFQHTSAMVALGKDISSRIGGKHFVIDTGRNGLGPWTGGTHSGGCAPQFNPPGRALGTKPTTTNTPDPLVDALLWLKYPGESDAACGGFPPAGSYVPEYGLGLAQRAAY